MAKEEGKAGRLTYQGVTVPEGVSLDAFMAMASLFNDYGDDLLLVNGEEATHYAAAAMAFELVRRESGKSRRGDERQD
ncbi:MAG: hypothetical protein AB7V39_04915 [Nitrospiraceae bacterium]